MAICDRAAFGGNGMGIGRLGDGDVIIKRKFRWTFEVTLYCNKQKVPAHFVKMASRPDITIEETELNFLNEKIFIPGKATFEAMNVTYIDVSTKDNLPLWTWIANVYDFSDPECRHMNTSIDSYAGRGDLRLLDGCGQFLEGWVLGNMWPSSVKFGELDYAQSETVDIELTLRYSRLQYQSACGSITRCPCGPVCT